MIWLLLVVCEKYQLKKKTSGRTWYRYMMIRKCYLVNWRVLPNFNCQCCYWLLSNPWWRHNVNLLSEITTFLWLIIAAGQVQSLMITWGVWLKQEKVLPTCAGWAPVLTVMISQAKSIPHRQPPIMMFLSSFWQIQSKAMCGLKHLLQREIISILPKV